MDEADRMPTVLIVLGEVLVAQDIAESIREKFAEAAIHVSSDIEEATMRLAHVERLDFAILGMGAQDFERSPLADAIAARGGKVILTGLDAEYDGDVAAWPVLMQPFTSESVWSLL